MSAWVRRCMELAVVTGRRADVARLGPHNVRDEEHWITQRKTGAKVRIALAPHLDAPVWPVG